MMYENFQKTSEEIFRERPSEHKDLINYHAAEKQSKDGSVPQEVMKIEKKDGMISVGISKDGVVSAVFSSTKDGMLREDRQSINAERTKRLGGGGRIYTNSHNEEKSALLYEQSIDKQGNFMMKRCRKYLMNRKNEAVEDSAPFLALTDTRKQWRQDEEFLQHRLDASREKMQRMLKKLRAGQAMLQTNIISDELIPEDEPGEGGSQENSSDKD